MKLINKTALVAEIERMKVNAIQFPFEEYGTVGTCNKLLSFLDTLEEKEVDDEKCKEYDKALSIAKSWYKSSDSSAQERNVTRMIMGDKVREKL